MPVEHLRAPAKLTTHLRVTGVRADGMHELDAEMITLDLYDELSIDATDVGVVLSTRGTVPDFPFDPADNLISRALRLAGVEARVELTKNIPAGAGLGGGSADAAAVLRWAGFADLAVATSIGADVAFCLVGGRARVRGIGEIVDPLPFKVATFTLVTPAVHCSTPMVYAMWDDMGGPTADGENDLEPAAVRLYPELVRVRDQLGNATGQTPQLAGSGSSWFVPGSFPDAGRIVHAVPPEDRPPVA